MSLRTTNIQSLINLILAILVRVFDTSFSADDLVKWVETLWSFNNLLCILKK